MGDSRRSWWSYWDDDDYDYDSGYGSSGYSYHGSSFDYLDWGYSSSSDYDSSSKHHHYHRPYRSSLGWGSDKVKSSYTLWSSSDSAEDKIDKAELLAKLFRSIRDIIVILDFPFPIDVRLSNNSMYASEAGARKLYVPTSVVDDDNYTRDEKSDILCGLGVHEASHLKYTEYRMVKSLMRLKSLNVGIREIDSDTGEIFSRFVYNLFNLIEDTRTEDKMLLERPGYFSFIEAEKKYRFDLFKKKWESDPKFNSDPLFKFLYNLVAFIRYPQEYDPKAYPTAIEKVKNILKIMPDSTKESYNSATKIFLELYSEILDNPTVYGITDVVRLKTKLSSFNTFIRASKIFETIYYGADEDSGMYLDPDSMSNVLKHSDADYVDKFITGYAITGSKKSTIFEYMNEGRIDVYNDIKRKISKYIPSIKKVITGVDKNYTFNIYGCRAGKLDENKLAEAYQGVSQVYVRQGKVTTNKTTVCILVDESGSMGCYIDIDRGRYATRSDVAREAAILLNEALGKLSGVELFVYGHSADESHMTGNTNLRIYKEPGNNPKISKYSLTEISDRRENRDGVAIQEVANRVRKFTDSNVLMFVISDGDPSAVNYRGWAAVNDTKKKVEEVKKMGFNIVQVCIDRVLHCHEMFENVISLDADVANLPKRLGQIVKKAIVADKKTTII